MLLEKHKKCLALSESDPIAGISDGKALRDTSLKRCFKKIEIGMATELCRCTQHEQFDCEPSASSLLSL